MRPTPVVVSIAFFLCAAGCRKADSNSDAAGGFLANASDEAKEALSAPVSFALNEDNFAKWEIAESNLDGIPPSELSAAARSGGSAIDRAVARLESSPRAKRAIESAGLSVRDFVLETVALAQAVQASQTGRSTVASGVADGNFAFVERYRDRIRSSVLESELARQSGDSEITDANTAAELAAANADRLADSLSRARDSLAQSRDPGMHRDSSRDSLSDSVSASQHTP
jgi:hypothetical protein